jgi:DNA-binding response OmpR family regulator
MFLDILIIEDNPDDLFFFKKTLEETGLNVEISVASDAYAGLNQIRQKEFDCIFLDYTIPGMNGLEILRKIRSEHMGVPIIMLTGQKDDQIIVNLMKSGATDYISKNNLSSNALRLSIETAKKMYQIRLEKAYAEQALKLSEASLSEAQKIAKLGNWEYDVQSKRSSISEEAGRILGYAKSSSPLFFTFMRQLHKQDLDSLRDFAETVRKNADYELTLRINVNGALKFIHVRGNITVDRKGKITRVIGTIQDVTLLKNALNDSIKAKIGRRATSIVFGIAIALFILSEALFDPFIDALQTSLLIGLSFKGGLALFFKPVESFLEKFMLNRVASTL